MDIRLAPLALNIEQVALSDFFARVILDPTGRINLQDVRVVNTGGLQKSVTRAEPTTASTPVTAPAAEKSAALPPPAQGARDIPPMKIKKLTLQGGHIRYTDNFIKPNYTANLMKFGGVISDLSSDANTSANVNLKGQVNSAPLTVDGKINPLKGDLTMDIKAAVSGMELAPLSPYSGRYIGYGIEKGKLSFDVTYKIENRVLTAQNRLVLEQLTLGEKVESPTATTLPVSFALSLLRKKGVRSSSVASSVTCIGAKSCKSNLGWIPAFAGMTNDQAQHLHENPANPSLKNLHNVFSPVKTGAFPRFAYHLPLATLIHQYSCCLP